MTGCSIRVALLLVFILSGAWLGVWRLVWSTGYRVVSPPQNIVIPPPKPAVADWIPEPDRRELYRLWRSLDQAFAYALPDLPDNADAFRRHLFRERLAELPIGKRTELGQFDLDLILLEGDRHGWDDDDGD